MHVLSVWESYSYDPQLRYMQALLAIPEIGSLVEGIAAYSERHAARAARLHRASFLLDYTLATMQVSTCPQSC